MSAGCGRTVALYGAAETDKFDTAAADADDDGWDVEEDCDDLDATRHPEAEETAGDGVDSNCDGEDDT
jgi:hypothetical protein